MSDQAVPIARAVEEAGGRALIVGGWVRDRLMGRESKDVDLEVYGLPADRLRELLTRFGSVNAVGESFTVFKVGDIDVALPRRESKVGRGHKGFEVHGDPNLSPVEAARRRDFTINAISWDPLRNTYADPFGGRDDIERRLLRAVDPSTFGDDSLRVLRAIQFAARFEFNLDPETEVLCPTIPLDDLPSERIWGEIEKLLLQAQRPSLGFDLALRIGVIDALFPEIKALVGCPQEPEWHPEGDVWIHTLMVVDQARTRIDDLPHPKKVAIMLGAVCHDLGKPPTTAFVDGRIRSIDHEQAGVEPASAVLDRLNVHSIGGFDVRREVLGITAHHLKPGMFGMSKTPVSDGAFRRLAQKVDLELLARLAKSDCMGRGGGFDCSSMDWFLERARQLGVEHAPPPPLLLGRHLFSLGVKPGPRMGEILRAVYERQLDGTVTTLDEGLAFAREYNLHSCSE
ncbi:MAG: CCA tRNA nucleotidyltransferase [Acidobacteriota bacterium]|nr:CCA tRNA nucleotidyltransferase [Acidobacteriota bacterium]MDQ3419879.1 CCA tRNA nucleotidyltransferase [Acidobacteriota bacterium]